MSFRRKNIILNTTSDSASDRTAEQRLELHFDPGAVQRLALSAQNLLDIRNVFSTEKHHLEHDQRFGIRSDGRTAPRVALRPRCSPKTRAECAESARYPQCLFDGKTSS